jgi:hypothetical protein
MSEVLAHPEITPQRPDWLAGDAVVIEAVSGSNSLLTGVRLSKINDLGGRLAALAAVISGSLKGQVEVFEAAEQAGLERKENWISDAVTRFENQGFVFNVVRPLGHPLQTLLMVPPKGESRPSLSVRGSPSKKKDQHGQEQ